MIDISRARNGFRVGGRVPLAVEGQTYGTVTVLDRIEPNVRGDGVPARYTNPYGEREMIEPHPHQLTRKRKGE